MGRRGNTHMSITYIQQQNYSCLLTPSESSDLSIKNTVPLRQSFSHGWLVMKVICNPFPEISGSLMPS